MFLHSTAAYLHTQQGTVAYMAPEMCEEDDYTAKADIWSLGVTFYQLATFKLPVSVKFCEYLAMMGEEGSSRNLESRSVVN